MRKIYSLIGGLIISAGINAQTTVNITDASLQGNTTYNWTNDKVYVLDGLVFLEAGGVLNIQEGTVVKFTPRPDLGNPSALVICRGAQIFANGTAANPIIFTAEDDDVDDATDLGPNDVSLWGGIAILGKAYTEKNGNTEVNLEGIPTTEPRGLYGMPAGQAVNNDNSGVLRYVSIRHCGREIASGSELNGLSLGAVGSGTTIEHVEVYASSDDGIEFFGGSVNVKYAAVAFAEDDSFDWDESWTGKGQFWFSIQRGDIADTGWECDGSTPDDTGIPSNPTVYNATHIGSGVGASASNPVGILLRAGTKGIVANSIIADMKGKGIEIQDKAANSTTDAFANLENGTLKFRNNLFWKIGSNSNIDTTVANSVIRFTSGSAQANRQVIVDSLVAWNNSIVPTSTNLIKSISRTQNNQLDPRPNTGTPALTSTLAPIPSDPFFTNVNFKGAFGPNSTDLWLRGWSTLHRNNHLLDVTSIEENNDNFANISIYPNPANNTFVVAFNSESPVMIDIININGQTVKSINVNNTGFNSQLVDVNDLTTGVYIVRLSNGYNVHTQKLVIE
ncbi:MAG: T9SS type A sorting domain-containing protein [Bacteroidia bacterium]